MVVLTSGMQCSLDLLLSWHLLLAPKPCLSDPYNIPVGSTLLCQGWSSCMQGQDSHPSWHCNPLSEDVGLAKGLCDIPVSNPCKAPNCLQKWIRCLGCKLCWCQDWDCGWMIWLCRWLFADHISASIVELRSTTYTHGLSCQWGKGRHLHHTAMNDIILILLTSFNIPSWLDPLGVYDKWKSTRWMLHHTWRKDKELIWDATCHMPRHLCTLTQCCRHERAKTILGTSRSRMHQPNAAYTRAQALILTLPLCYLYLVATSCSYSCPRWSWPSITCTGGVFPPSTGKNTLLCTHYGHYQL